jgi:hypothetical protein
MSLQGDLVIAGRLQQLLFYLAPVSAILAFLYTTTLGNLEKNTKE